MISENQIQYKQKSGDASQRLHQITNYNLNTNTITFKNNHFI
ncbi:hypothetical protein SAMN05216518_102166 [Bacteroidales bacterium KHT7]|nr:hypothetical protein SAMN05216518_102166 [Bacteroidales bacterium KHT7]